MPGPAAAFIVVACALLPGPAGLAQKASAFERISVDRTQLDAALGHTAAVAVNIRRPGTLDVQVVDRDGFPVRRLARSASAAVGVNRFQWDGRDDGRRIVPDEAYSLHIEWSSGPDHEVYFPANTRVQMKSVTPNGYSPVSATLSYVLDEPSRVHVQAGVAERNSRTGKTEGPVMKTIVNRAPRSGGRIAEHWNGLDESGTIFIPDLPNFAVAIATTPLPENSVITVGNRERTFAEAALARTGRSLFTLAAGSHSHHAGLSVLDDLSPGLQIVPLNAKWSEQERVWVTHEARLKVRLKLTGPAAASFARQPARLSRFVNQKLIAESKATEGVVTVALPGATANVQIVSFNWCSDYGAVAANTLRVRREHPRRPAANATKGSPK